MNVSIRSAKRTRRQETHRRPKATGSPLALIVKMSKPRLALILVSVLGVALLTGAVRAYNHAALMRGRSMSPWTLAMLPQGNATPRLSAVLGRLALQPEADRFRRKLGWRFLAPGLDRTTLVGILKLGAQEHQVHIVRTQLDNDESVAIAVDGIGSFTWNATEGAKSGTSSLSKDERAVIERLALDSPEQFVLAQLRGAAYYTVARTARPSDVGASDTYDGPVWDVVQISEPIGSGAAAPVSAWRLYHINTATGLIDKVVSQEQQGQDLTAEITNWTSQGSEILPSHITWKQAAQTLMELTLSGAAFGPRQ